MNQMKFRKMQILLGKIYEWGSPYLKYSKFFRALLPNPIENDFQDFWCSKILSGNF